MKKHIQEARQDVPMDAYSVRLTAWHARQARRIGNGEVSEGIRAAIELAANKKPAEAG